MSPHGAIVHDYAGLIAALADRRRSLGVSQFELDQRAGLQDGYTGKVEAWAGPHGRGIGPLVLPLLLGALKVVLIVKPLAKPCAVQSYNDNQMLLALEGGTMAKLPKELYNRRYRPSQSMQSKEKKAV